MDQKPNQTDSPCRQRHDGHGHKKHMIIMMLICLIAVIIYVFGPQLKLRAVNWNWLILLLCPVIHGLMMIPLMLNKNRTKQEQTTDKVD